MVMQVLSLFASLNVAIPMIVGSITYWDYDGENLTREEGKRKFE